MLPTDEGTASLSTMTSLAIDSSAQQCFWLPCCQAAVQQAHAKLGRSLNAVFDYEFGSSCDQTVMPHCCCRKGAAPAAGLV